MKKVVSLIIAIACLLFSLCLSACSPTTDGFSASYFNTHIYVQSVDKTISQTTKNKLNNLFSQLELEFDISDENSFVYKFNHAPNGSTFNLSDHGVAVFKKAIECHGFTNGLFNPAVFPLVELWQFAPDYPAINFQPPSNEKIEQTLTLVDFESVSFDENAKTVTKTKDNVKLDFGGILKGYASDLAMQILLDDGHQKGYVNIGTSSINILQCDKLDVRHPRQTMDTPIIFSINTANLNNISVSSSGDYEKVYTVDNKSYCHIINPYNGIPANTGVQSVTLLGVDGITLDAISTAACLLTHSPENISNSELVSFLNKTQSTYPNTIIFAVFDDGNVKQIITNQTANKDFVLHDNAYSIVNL